MSEGASISWLAGSSEGSGRTAPAVAERSLKGISDHMAAHKVQAGGLVSLIPSL